MPDLALIIAAAALAVLFTHLRRQRQTYEIIRELRSGAEQRVAAPRGVSLDDMQDLVDELADTLRPTSHVTAQSNTLPPHHALRETGHVWSSPCGKRVYIN